ncbi:MAG: hypothetical protein JO153_05430 [Solirubrobacterales bacterium]|nr:hypothetical protein [Solirubrobacterales bacterium]
MIAAQPFRMVVVIVAALALGLAVAVGRPQPAQAGVCGAAGFFSGWVGRACSVLTHPDTVIKAGKSLATGHPGKAIKAIIGGGGGGGGGGSGVSRAVGLAAVTAWVVVGARTALHATASVISRTTRPQLGTTWFSSTYWRIAAIAALLTLPFLFAATVQAILRSDIALLWRATLGYLPLSLLAVSIAAPLTTLLLAAADQMSNAVSAAAGNAGVRFLRQAGVETIGLSAVTRSPFLVFMVALLTSAATIALWIELLMRDAAVYVVVLMLPLAFAALVWPARRVWALRSVELLVALILSKFAIVAVLALGAGALGQSAGGAGMLIGLVLVLLAAFSPWALVRLLPLAELASGAAGHLAGGLDRVQQTHKKAEPKAGAASEWAGSVVASMRRQARDSDAVAPAGADAPPADAEAPADGVAPGDPEAPADDAPDTPPSGVPETATTEAAPAEPVDAEGEGAAARDAAGKPEGRENPETSSPDARPASATAGGNGVPSGNTERLEPQFDPHRRAAHRNGVTASDHLSVAEAGELAAAMPEMYGSSDEMTMILGSEGLTPGPLGRENDGSGGRAADGAGANPAAAERGSREAGVDAGPAGGSLADLPGPARSERQQSSGRERREGRQ